MKLAVLGHVRDYLHYAKYFDVYIDFNALTFIKTICKLNAIGQKWVNELANFNFSTNYKPGIKNNVADILNRFPVSSSDREHYKETYSVE